MPTVNLSSLAGAMTPEQVQDIVMGTIAAAIQTGDLSPGGLQGPEIEMPEAPEQEMAEQAGQMQPPPMPEPPAELEGDRA